MNDKQRSVPCPECGGSGCDEFGNCDACQGHGYVLVARDDEQPPKIEA